MIKELKSASKLNFKKRGKLMKKILLLTCMMCIITLMFTGCGGKTISEVVSNADTLTTIAKTTEELDLIVKGIHIVLLLILNQKKII